MLDSEGQVVGTGYSKGQLLILGIFHWHRNDRKPGLGKEMGLGSAALKGASVKARLANTSGTHGPSPILLSSRTSPVGERSMFNILKATELSLMLYYSILSDLY